MKNKNSLKNDTRRFIGKIREIRKRFRKVDLSLPGGCENEIAKLFPELNRESGALYDFVDPNSGQKYEMKKTKDDRLQSWIDPIKFINLKMEDRKIIFRFVKYKKTGVCEYYVDTKLGEIIDAFVTDEMISLAKRAKKLFPKRSEFQFKLNIKLR